MWRNEERMAHERAKSCKIGFMVHAAAFRNSLALLLLFLAAATIDARAASLSPLTGEIVCFGDSITAASKLNPGERWVAQLAEKNQQMTTINESVATRTSTDAAGLRQAIGRDPDANTWIILLGTNDLKRAHEGIVQQVRANIGVLVDTVRQQQPSADIVICSPPNVGLKRLDPELRENGGMGAQTAHWLYRLQGTLRGLAMEKGVRYVDLFGVVQPQDFIDGIVPNAEGQTELANAIWDQLTR
jgi:lysophospholipase L1-like esterase